MTTNDVDDNAPAADASPADTPDDCGLRDGVGIQELLGAGVVFGSQTVSDHSVTYRNRDNNYGAVNHGTVNIYAAAATADETTKDPWDGALEAVTTPPEPSCLVAAADVALQAAALRERRVLLVRHAPTRQEEAESAMRAVLHAVREQEPRRDTYRGGGDRPFALQNLYRCGAWPANRHGAAIYLYRSADPAAYDFFGIIEQVDRLRERLVQTDSHLLLTITSQRGVRLRDETALARRIAIWTLDDDAPDPAIHAAAINDAFDATLAFCAAFFPGLGAGEFVELVDMLAPQPTGTSEAAPRDGHLERWRRGDRDSVMAELGIRWQAPPGGVDGGENAEWGMYFDDPNRRAELPSWLYGRYPSLVLGAIGALATHYFSARASARYRVGYRRLVVQADMTRLLPFDAVSLAQRLRAGLDGDADGARVAAHRIGELAGALPDSDDGRRHVANLIAAMASIVPEIETRLIHDLHEHGLIERLIAAKAVPYTHAFWSKQHRDADAAPHVARAAQCHAVVIELLLRLAASDPAGVVDALGGALHRSNAAHWSWINAAGLRPERATVQSLARAVFRDVQSGWLRRAADEWLAFVQAIAAAGVPAAAMAAGESTVDIDDEAMAISRERQRAARQDWISWDCVVALVTVFDDVVSGRWLRSAHRVFVRDDVSRRRFAAVLVPLLQATMRRAAAGSRTPADIGIDGGTTFWLYQTLVFAALTHEPDGPARALAIDELLAPWCDELQRAQRAALVEIARRELGVAQRALQRCSVSRRQEFRRSIDALRLVVARLRGRA